MFTLQSSNGIARPALSQRLKTRKPSAEPLHASGHLTGPAYPMAAHQNGSSRMSMSCITLEEALQSTAVPRTGRGSTMQASAAAVSAYTEEQDYYQLSSATSFEVQAALLSQLAAFSRELLESAPWDPEPQDGYELPQSLLPPAQMPTCPVDLMQNLAATTRQMLAYEPPRYQ